MAPRRHGTHLSSLKNGRSRAKSATNGLKETLKAQDTNLMYKGRHKQEVESKHLINISGSSIPNFKSCNIVFAVQHYLDTIVFSLRMCNSNATIIYSRIN